MMANDLFRVHCAKCHKIVDCTCDRIDIVSRVKKPEEHHLSLGAWQTKKIKTYHKNCYDKRKR